MIPIVERTVVLIESVEQLASLIELLNDRPALAAGRPAGQITIESWLRGARATSLPLQLVIRPFEDRYELHVIPSADTTTDYITMSALCGSGAVRTGTILYDSAGPKYRVDFIYPGNSMAAITELYSGTKKMCKLSSLLKEAKPREEVLVDQQPT